MNLLMCHKLQKSFGTSEILTDVSFILEEKEKAALIGVNGAGKTSVFRLLTGEWPLDGGEIIKSPVAQIGYLPQAALQQDHTNTRNLYEELDTVFEPLREMEAAIRKLEHEMSGYKDNVPDSLATRYSKLTEDFEAKDGFSAASRLRGVLTGLGFTKDQWQQPVNSLSGGQQTRAALGKLLLTAPDILLLDEPTNHLDIASISWLEDYLKEYSGGVLLISHDRYFLDRVTTKTIEIENKKSTIYNGNYSFYAKHKAINRENALRQYLNQQKDIKRQEKIIATFHARSTERNHIQAKVREKLLNKMIKEESLEKPDALPDHMRLILKPKIETGYDVLDATDLSMSFDGKTIFSNIKLSLKKGDKAALIGPNGIGKTTLFKVIMGEYNSPTGEIVPGVHLRIGYYDQASQNMTHISDKKTVFQEIADTYPTLTQTEIRSVLAAFLFVGDDVFKLIQQLSGGERGRVALAKIMLSGANLLILDEPTNHLDLFSKEILEEALSGFPGTVLYISHDRYFINRTATKVLEMSALGLTEYLGDYDYYLDKKNFTKSQMQANAKTSVISKASNTSKNKWQAKKETDALIRKQESKKKRIEQTIQEIEDKIAGCDSKLALDDIARDAEAAMAIFSEKASLEEELLEMYNSYVELI